MNGLCITDAVKLFGLTSKTLRYYERVGLLEAKRAGHNNYRYYDESEVERIRQIMVLRKMQISIKDIIRIYENADMRTVAEVFVNRVNAIDEEIGALSELKRITHDFLQVMLKNGVTKISALPILYEQMEKRLINYTDLSSLSDKLEKPAAPSILCLPPMRVLSSVCKDGSSDADGFWRWVQAKNIPLGEPGQHVCFEFQSHEGDVFMLKISDDFVNDSAYTDYVFPGGLFAVVNVYLDEDMGAQFRLLVEAFDDNKYYQIDYQRDGNLRHAAMLENLISPDDQRELVSLFVPVKKRQPDSALFDRPLESTNSTIAEIEAANPVLYTKKAALDNLTLVRPSGGHIHYETLPTGEVVFATYVRSRYLSSNIEVKLPFRVDFTFKFDQIPGNADAGIRIYHGNYEFAVNERNHVDPAYSKHSILFNQPIFGDSFVYDYAGAVDRGAYNTVTWIVGEAHLAVIINNELRLCLKNMPYMKTNLIDSSQPILINGGGDMRITIKEIAISQLMRKRKNKAKKGALTMITKQSNNVIRHIETYCVGERGENFAFDGACQRLMECLGEQEYDYWLIAGVTGDCYAQVYPKKQVFFSDRYCVADYHILYNDDCSAYIEGVFDKLGYACTYVPKEKLMANKEMYRQTLMAYIDKGTPVMQFKGNYSLICGYEEHGNTLLNKWPCSKDFDKFALDEEYFADKELRGWIFVGEKKAQKNLADLYRQAILKMPDMMTVETDKYYFGAGAFRAWAADIESGLYDGKTQDGVDLWETHTSFVAAFETIAAMCNVFLSKALELNPDLGFIAKVIPLFESLSAREKGGLENVSGGFNVTLEALQDKEQRAKIADRIRSFADVMDAIVGILTANLKLS